MKRSSPPRRTSLPRRTRPAKRVNANRKAREFRRCFWSAERVEYVKTLPCIITGERGKRENAHIPNAEGSGAGRRGNYDQIVPLSLTLHRLQHSTDTKLWRKVSAGVDWKRGAAWTEAMWRCYAEENGLPHAGTSV